VRRISASRPPQPTQVSGRGFAIDRSPRPGVAGSISLVTRLLVVAGRAGAPKTRHKPGAFAKRTYEEDLVSCVCPPRRRPRKGFEHQPVIRDHGAASKRGVRTAALQRLSGKPWPLSHKRPIGRSPHKSNSLAPTWRASSTARPAFAGFLPKRRALLLRPNSPNAMPRGRTPQMVERAERQAAASGGR
jgi:hypothetical protein